MKLIEKYCEIDMESSDHSLISVFLNTLDSFFEQYKAENKIAEKEKLFYVAAYHSISINLGLNENHDSPYYDICIDSSDSIEDVLEVLDYLLPNFDDFKVYKESPFDDRLSTEEGLYFVNTKNKTERLNYERVENMVSILVNNKLNSCVASFSKYLMSNVPKEVFYKIYGAKNDEATEEVDYILSSVLG
jgi:hypothetical protein